MSLTVFFTANNYAFYCYVYIFINNKVNVADLKKKKIGKYFLQDFLFNKK